MSHTANNTLARKVLASAMSIVGGLVPAGLVTWMNTGGLPHSLRFVLSSNTLTIVVLVILPLAGFLVLRVLLKVLGMKDRTVFVGFYFAAYIVGFFYLAFQALGP